MSAIPPIPPHPVDPAQYSARPPLPPLPPNALDYEKSQPHFEAPLAAPRPHKLQPDLPAEMARTLDHQISRDPSFTPSLSNYNVPPPPPPPGQAGYGSPAPAGFNPNPGFANPGAARGATPLPPPAGSDWSPWNFPQPQPSTSSPSQPPPGPPPPPQGHRPFPSYSSPRNPTLPPGTPDSLSPAMGAMSIHPPPATAAAAADPPSLTAPLPTISSLLAAEQPIQNPNGNPASKLAWSRDVLSLVERMHPPPEDAPPGPVHITDSELSRLADIAVPLILQLAGTQHPIPEAVYLRATLEASGAFPRHVQTNPRAAFRDYEKAARAGFHKAWFKLGRDYENFGDFPHAKDCFERGVRNNDESCLYRMGMANLLGQLGLTASPESALPLLQRAATLATVDVPQPAYIFGLLLLGEFSPAQLPQHLLSPNDARRHLERAAYLHFAPAQYKLGHSYEFASAPFPFDALLSVQYYSLASQQGEVEADMALSKWFLCGAEGAFDKDEALAFTFAEKSARKGLPSAEFAMGYYTEVGVGGPKDIDAARKWYTRASQHGNADAAERLAALSHPAPQALSRQEHDQLTDVTLVRKRTQAKQRSDARGGATQAAMPVAGGQQMIATIRQNSLAYRPPREPAAATPPVAQPPAQSQPYAAGPGPSAQAYAQGPPPTQAYAQGPPQQQQGPPPPQAQNFSPGHAPRPSAEARQYSGPPGAGPAAWRGQPRFGLTDHGATPPPQGPPQQGPPPSQQVTPPLRARPRPQQSAPAPAPGPPQDGRTPPPQKGPATFQEMGFQSQKLEEKECVIM
ncbi:HCP-like protein [Auriscalpium vulgare]|uniref:HCP-like protein n=1 Tax=Auriscalpium vulgare TaxID=40419 RepID=A0ACB8S5E9_9AGAM|nr:HCP-like protein [Auriscalpium vulgare]